MTGTFPNDAIRAAMVDLDGTMVDSSTDLIAAVNLMLAELGMAQVEHDAALRLIGKGSDHLVRSALALSASACALAAEGGDGDAGLQLFPRARESFLRHYAHVNGHHSVVFPGVEQGLQALLAKGWKLACLTNKPTAFTLPLLKAKGLDRYFSQVFGGDAFSRLKPDPLPLLKTCEALGTRPEQTLMIGDSSNDARAARAAGCPVVLVTYGYNHGAPVREEDADGFIDSLAELA
ncbi:MAG: phosphoglycolate phosphatase [Noviherbaspirillum sp.]